MDKEEKRPSRLRRVLAFLLTAALVLGSVFLVANWQKLNFDFIRRYFAYHSLKRNEHGQVESFSYDGGLNSSFIRVGGDLLVCSAGGVRLYSESGAAYVDQVCALANPVLASSGDTALVYDAGGRDLFVYKDHALAFSLNASEGHTLLAASLSAQGRLVTVTQQSGVKGSVTVYDESFQPSWGVNLSSRFVTDAILSPDGNTLAVLTAGQTAGVYDSQISLYSQNHAAGDSTPDAVCSLGNNAALKVAWPSGPLRVLGETALCYVGADGTLSGSYAYAFRYLKGFSLEGDGFSTLLLGKYRAGTEAELVTVGTDGEVIASLPLDQQILSLSSAGRYLSILTADGLSTYTSDLKLYHSSADLPGTRKILQRPDGTVTLLGDENARLYLPD